MISAIGRHILVCVSVEACVLSIFVNFIRYMIYRVLTLTDILETPGDVVQESGSGCLTHFLLADSVKLCGR